MTDIKCATYSVWFRNRRTRQPVDCDLTGAAVVGKWRRNLRETSIADLMIALPADERCCDCAPTANVDELVIERHGDRSEIVWVGPVTVVDEDQPLGELRIEASDPSYWWDRRQAFQQAETLEQVDIVDAWLAVREDQDRRDPSGLIPKIVDRTGRLVSINWAADAETASVLIELEDVAWTVAAGVLYGPGETTVGPEPFASLDASEDWESASGTSGALIRGDGTATADRGGRHR